MADPARIHSLIAQFVADRGLDLNVSLLDAPPEQVDRSHIERIREATEYADTHIPARYIAARADHPEILTWCEALQAASSHGPAGTYLGTGPSLLLLGATGTGKTHQGYGALRHLADNGIRALWVAMTAADLYGRLQPRHGVDSETEFRAIAGAPLLLLDDVGAAKGSEWVEQINYRLINWRYERILPTLYTSNVPPKELASRLGERVASRLIEMASRVVLSGPDRRRVTR